MKLSYIRAWFESDPSWADTSERYVLRLFMEYIFKQYTEEGEPSLDWGLTFEALNKLDAGAIGRG
jgi:hypothetical protein